MHPLLQVAFNELERSTAGLTTEDLERAPAGKWSPAGILEHLAITYDGTRRVFEKRLEDKRPASVRRTLRQRVGVLVVVEIGYFPTGVAAPEFTRPTGLRGAAARDAALATLRAMDGAMAACEELDVRGAIADHPILGPLTLRQWRRFHRVHTLHHAKQIRARAR